MTKVKTTISYVILVLASFLSAFPLYYMISGATNASIDIVRGKLIPGTHLLENYRTLIETQNLGLAMFNSFRNAIVITVISLLVCSIAGYGFEIYHDKGKDVLWHRIRFTNTYVSGICVICGIDVRCRIYLDS